MKIFFLKLTLISGILLTLGTCTDKPKTLFRLLEPGESGINFENTVTQTDTFNILTYEYIYNGGGVAISDFNNDGLQDIFFTGNQVGNKLYLNKGNFKFEDVTAEAHVNVPGRWNSGVALVDINNDGWMDLYVCATTKPHPEDRRNMLFVNQGIGPDGKPSFKEMAADYKIDYNGHSVMAAFLDYDHDGDLDLYILVNQKLKKVASTSFRPKITDGSAENNDRLFRNEGNGTFTDVTIEAGITWEGYGLGLAIADFNNDGWPDIYVSNDYLSNDILYLNNKNGTFKNSTSEFVGHQSQFSMGNDASDINNDGMQDIMTLDMLPETSERKKTTIGNKNYLSSINAEQFQYEYQYVRNMLQLNNGLDRGARFSEIGQLSGIFQTEWSWSPLFADFDNDGNKDLAVTNGFPKDITDKDFSNYRAAIMNIAAPRFMIDSIPVVKIPNYAFRNNGDLTFTDVSKSWGLNQPSFSNGAAFADLDNDGDLDYVVNNINSPAFVYENRLYTSGTDKVREQNYLRIKLKGPASNLSGIGSKVTLHHQGKIQYHDYSIYRGYLSSVEGFTHFGLGKSIRADSLTVQWPDGKVQTIRDVAANQVMVINYSDARETYHPVLPAKSIFSEVSKSQNILYKDTQKDVVDFDFQRTIPHKYSQYSPALAVGDIDGDHLDDLFIAGPSGTEGVFFVQQKDGKFKLSGDRIHGEKVKIYADAGALLFDADNDNDLDLYVVSGGFEWEKESKNYQDRLYINDGKGEFIRAEGALPVMTSSGSCVRAADYDGDGDLDLFVGGRVLPREYPYAPDSYILNNDHGKFTDVTDQLCPNLKKIGMVTDAIWSDFDNDGNMDLVLSGELMPVTFVRNNKTSFNIIRSDIDKHKGWWNSIVAGDFDRDGDMDYVAGNLGQNNYYCVSDKQPLKVFAKDLDGNGSVDAITACYFKMRDGSMQLCPAHFWDELNAQSPRFRRQFSKYKYFGAVTMDKLLSEKDLEGALVMDANYSSTSYIENLGNGKFKMTPLPIEAQFGPVFGMVIDDYDGDGELDVVLVGNDFGNEVFAGRYDALTGLVLKGDGKGNFKTVKSTRSGFYVAGDAKALAKLTKPNGEELFLASQNKDSLKVFIPAKEPQSIVDIQPDDAFGILTWSTGKKERVEFYYGHGFMSQSSRKFKVPKGVIDMSIGNFKGNSRKVPLNKT